MSGRRYLAVTVDTEVDKDPSWRVSAPATFRSVGSAIPELMTPLFEEFGVVPTYLLSPEVIEHPESRAVLERLDGLAELGTHLHGEFVEPERKLWPETMAGQPTDAVQAAYPRELEQAKLAEITRAFERAFGRSPTSFRAGRFGSGPHTLEILSELGYRVDSSVTPGLRWRYGSCEIDHRRWTSAPRRLSTATGQIVELPVGVRVPGSTGAWLANAPRPLARAAGRALGMRGQAHWLRPSWLDGDALIRYVEGTHDRILVLMMHSVELVPGASPYAQDEQGVQRILDSLRRLFEHCAGRDIRFCGLTAAGAHA